MQQPTYTYYKQVFANTPMPFAFVDLDLFDENVHQIALRAGNKKIRIATKSVRVPKLVERVLQNPAYQGLMTYSAAETDALAALGFDDFLMGYPCFAERDITTLANLAKQGKTVTLMVDNIAQANQINSVAQKLGIVLGVCIDLDMSSDFPGIHFGVWRSSLRTAKQAIDLFNQLTQLHNINVEGVMGYEAQIAGLNEDVPGQWFMNNVIRTLKKKSVKEIAQRRTDVLTHIKNQNHTLRLVNGGGTGSLETTKQEPMITEVTVGSGFFAPGVFDHYLAFKHHPAAAFAIEITRKPAPNTYTCLGGGYIASGAVGVAKQPKPYLPVGFELFKDEGTGEVQTPIKYSGVENLQHGDPIFFRHGKAGELFERFNDCHLVSQGQIVDTVKSYRGMGYCFL